MTYADWGVTAPWEHRGLQVVSLELYATKVAPVVRAAKWPDWVELLDGCCS